MCFEGGPSFLASPLFFFRVAPSKPLPPLFIGHFVYWDQIPFASFHHRSPRQLQNHLVAISAHHKPHWLAPHPNHVSLEESVRQNEVHFVHITKCETFLKLEHPTFKRHIKRHLLCLMRLILCKLHVNGLAHSMCWQTQLLRKLRAHKSVHCPCLNQTWCRYPP